LIDDSQLLPVLTLITIADDSDLRALYVTHMARLRLPDCLDKLFLAVDKDHPSTEAAYDNEAPYALSDEEDMLPRLQQDFGQCL